MASIYDIVGLLKKNAGIEFRIVDHGEGRMEDQFGEVSFFESELPDDDYPIILVIHVIDPLMPYDGDRRCPRFGTGGARASLTISLESSDDVEEDFFVINLWFFDENIWSMKIAADSLIDRLKERGSIAVFGDLVCHCCLSRRQSDSVSASFRETGRLN